LASIDVLNAVPLVAEAARVCEVDPGALTFVDASWRTTPTLIIRDIHCRRVALRDNEYLVREGVLGAEILASVDTATFFEGLSHGERLFLTTSIFYGHRAACYNSEEGSRVIMPGNHLAGRKAYCSKGYSGGTADEVRVGDVAHRYDDRSGGIGNHAESDEAEADYHCRLVFEWIRFHDYLLFELKFHKSAKLNTWHVRTPTTLVSAFGRVRLATGSYRPARVHCSGYPLRPMDPAKPAILVKLALRSGPAKPDSEVLESALWVRPARQ
jgi:hypothetical protein